MGKALRRELEGLRSARRGDFRVICRITDIVAIDRTDFYRSKLNRRDGRRVGWLIVVATRSVRFGGKTTWSRVSATARREGPVMPNCRHYAASGRARWDG